MTKFEKTGWRAVMFAFLAIAGVCWSDITIVTYDIATWIHEFGHALFSFGGEISGSMCYVNVDWVIGRMGSMFVQHILSAVIVVFGALYFKPLAGFGFGWSVYVTKEVFQFDAAQFAGDMAKNTAVWYPSTIVCTAAVIMVFIYASVTGRAPGGKTYQRIKAWWVKNLEVQDGYIRRDTTQT